MRIRPREASSENEWANSASLTISASPKLSWYWCRQFTSRIAPPLNVPQVHPAAIRLSASKSCNIHADGTDDVQLIVSIVDADGHELSNSPTVTLRIVSGPGELPTGRSITFAKDSDIRIEDGQCAITLRSYYAGQTIVEATSDGLRPDSITLNFVGAASLSAGNNSANGTSAVRQVHKSRTPVTDLRVEQSYFCQQQCIPAIPPVLPPTATHRLIGSPRPPTRPPHGRSTPNAVCLFKRFTPLSSPRYQPS